MQKSGRKIKRSKSLYGNRRKNRIKSIFAIIFTIITAGVLIFLGYSVGEPIANFFKNWKSESSSSSEPWTPSQVETYNSAESSESQDQQGNTSAKPIQSDFNAYKLSGADLVDLNTLTNTVENVKVNGYTAIIVPVKGDGGYLYYNSSIETAKTNELIKSNLSLNEILDTIKNNNLVAIADIQMLKDQMYSLFDKEAGYTFDNSTSAWYDNDPSAGGKPWISPFSTSAKTYLSQIMGEVSSSNFDMIICSDVIFPPFRNSDLDYIGQIVKDPNRYKALIDIVNVASNDCKANNKNFGLEVSAVEIIQGRCEVFKPDELPDLTLICQYDLSDGSKVIIDNQEIILSSMQTYDRVKYVYEQVKKNAGNYEVIPVINQANLQVGDLNEALRALSDLGYTKYIVE